MVLSSPRSGRAPCREATRMATIEIRARGSRQRGVGVWAPALALAACAPAPLTPAGARVELARAPRPGCALVAPLRGSAGYNGRAGDTNAADVEIYLRNQTAERGGDTLVITSRQLGAGRPEGAAPRDGETLSQPRGASTSGGCPNCVAITANAYRCAAAAPTPPAATTATPAPALASAAPERDPPFASRAAEAALAAAAESARRCRSAGAPAGEAQVKVTFAVTGDVVYSEVLGEPFAGTRAGECVARKFRNARVPPFAGEARSLTATVRLED